MTVLVLRVGVRKVLFGSQPVTGQGSACLAYAQGLRSGHAVESIYVGPILSLCTWSPRHLQWVWPLLYS